MNRNWWRGVLSIGGLTVAGAGCGEWDRWWVLDGSSLGAAWRGGLRTRGQAGERNAGARLGRGARRW
ncbi:MAG: hypothetical protein HC933_13690 [Pleurocapsa sp. SU_196_0]|nr:hypothetical protein [Pleurocapsa sp. SU_196_0]